jgi:hypothetical protein
MQTSSLTKAERRTSSKGFAQMKSITVITLLLRAIDRVPIQKIFDRHSYESRRDALPGSRLLKTLVVFQMIATPFMRGLIRTVDDHSSLQTALGGTLKRNTLSNALAHSDLDLMVEAWMLLMQAYYPYIARMGKKFARIAVVDATLIKLSLLAFNWAAYREQSGAAKLSAVLDWTKGIPQQLVLTTGKVHDLTAAAAFNWVANWTYIFDRGYVGFDFLTIILEAGAHFVIRLKREIKYEVVESFAVPEAPKSAGLTLLSDEHITFPNWGGVILRLVSYRLPDKKIYRILTDRFDLSALSVAQLYKNRWAIETWWKWLKQMFKIKRPLGESENALQLQIVSAFVTDLLLKAFEHSSGFTSGLYDFVSRSKEASLTPISEMPKDNALRKALEAILKLFDDNYFCPQLVT